MAAPNSPAKPKRRTRKAIAQRRRQRRLAATLHDLAPEHWEALQAAWQGCAYCGKQGVPLQKDCVLAISRGGRYTLGNVVPACGPCNTSKCNEEVTAWLRRKRLAEALFLQRHHAIRTALLARFPAAVPSPITSPGPTSQAKRPKPPSPRRVAL